MKIDKKVIIVNTLLLLSLFLIAEFAAWVLTFINVNININYTSHRPQGKLFVPKYRLFDNKTFEQRYEMLQGQLRPPAGLKSKKRPLVIFGCSFAYGEHLEDNQAFAYKLSAATKRPVYNRAYNGWGIQHMLYQLQNEPALDEIKNPEYVIFVFVNDQIRRLKMYCFSPNFAVWPGNNYPYPRYIEKNGHLERKKYLFPALSNSIFLNSLHYVYDQRAVLAAEKNPFVRKKLGDLLKLHFLESRKLINEKWPDAKVVIIKYYSYAPDETMWYGLDYIWNDLVREGFIILDAEDVAGKDLSASGLVLPDKHPNEHAWDVIVPALVKKLRL